MAIFNSYVSLPEGNQNGSENSTFNSVVGWVGFSGTTWLEEADRITLFELLQMLAVKDAHKEDSLGTLEPLGQRSQKFWAQLCRCSQGIALENLQFLTLWRYKQYIFI